MSGVLGWEQGDTRARGEKEERRGKRVVFAHATCHYNVPGFRFKVQKHAGRLGARHYAHTLLFLKGLKSSFQALSSTL